MLYFEKVLAETRGLRIVHIWRETFPVKFYAVSAVNCKTAQADLDPRCQAATITRYAVISTIYSLLRDK